MENTNEPRPKQLIFLHSKLDDFGLSAAEFRVFAHLHRRRNNKTGIAFPGIDSMAKTCRLAKQTIIEAVRGLETRNMIDVQRHDGSKTIYRINPDSEWEPFPNLDRSEADTDLNQGTVAVQNREHVKDILLKGIHEGTP
jgi:hypothetical protein